MKSNLSIGTFVTSLAIVALTVVVLTHGLLLTVTWNTVDEANERGARGAAENTARSLSNLINLLNQSLIGQANDPRLAGIIAQANPSMTRLEEDRITRMVPGAWLVRLLPDNTDLPDESRSPRMGFSDLNMVRAALTEKTQPGINLANSPDAHLAIVQRLPDGGGLLHASWPIKLLDGIMADQGTCGIELRQEQTGLVYRGGANCKENQPTGEVSVDGAPWKIAYWTRTDVSSSVGWFAAALIGSFCLIGGFAFIFVRRLSASLNQDRRNLVSLVKDLQSGNPFSDYHFKLNEFVHMAAEISKSKRMARNKMPQQPRVEPRPQPVLRVVENPPAKAEAMQRELDHKDDNEVNLEVCPTIFRAYDIRGVVGETITPDVVYTIGLAIGSEMNARGFNYVAVAQDGRLSSPELSNSLAKGLMDSGRTVIDLGLAPTPLLYYATHVLKSQSGVMVTGSHNPANYNGLKIVIGGDTLAESDIQKLRRRIEQKDFVTGSGAMEKYNLVPEYIERVLGDTQLGHNLKIVMDCGNGAASVVAPNLVRSLGCEVIELFCEVDGHFPNHHPDPSKPENLQALIDKVIGSKADLGVAFDGDGDRLGLVDSSGRIIWPDRQMMLFAADVLSREPGMDIIYDVKCSRHLPGQIVKNGGRPLMWKSGHAPIKAKMKETGAMLAGEMSGHFYFQERWYGFDDGIYACARMIEILSNAFETSAEIFAHLPDSINTPEFDVPLGKEGENFSIIEKLRTRAEFSNARVADIDGLRVDFQDGWGLVRASNTMPSLNFRFEAENEMAMARIQNQFRELLRQVKPDIKLPF